MLKEMIKRAWANKLFGIATTLALATLYITFSTNDQLDRTILNQSLTTSHYLSKAKVKISEGLKKTYDYMIK